MKKAPVVRPRSIRKPQDMKKVLFTRFMLIVAVFLLWIGGSFRKVQVARHQCKWCFEFVGSITHEFGQNLGSFMLQSQFDFLVFKGRA